FLLIDNCLTLGIDTHFIGGGNPSVPMQVSTESETDCAQGTHPQKIATSRDRGSRIELSSFFHEIIASLFTRLLPVPSLINSCYVTRNSLFTNPISLPHGTRFAHQVSKFGSGGVTMPG